MFNCDLKAHWNDRQKSRYFFVSNVALLGGGFLSLVAGIWLYCSKNYFVELTPSSYSALSAAGLCVFSGVTICIITGVGYLAVAWNNRQLFRSYVLFVGLLILIHSVSRVTGFFHKDGAREHLRRTMIRNINTTAVFTKIGRELKLAITWDHLQRELQCCGVDVYTDWHYSVHWPANVYLPDSCCDPKYFTEGSDMANCGKVPEAVQYVFKEGCFPKFADWLYHHITYVNWVSSILVVIETFTFTFACFMMGVLKRMEAYEKRRRERREQQRNDESVERFRLNSMDRIGDANEEPEPEEPTTATTAA